MPCALNDAYERAIVPRLSLFRIYLCSFGLSGSFAATGPFCKPKVHSRRQGENRLGLAIMRVRQTLRDGVV